MADVRRGDGDDVPHPGGRRGGEGVAGEDGVDPLGQQEEPIDAVECGLQGVGCAEVRDDELDPSRQRDCPGGLANECPDHDAPLVELTNQLAADVPGGPGDWLTDAGRALREPVEASRLRMDEQITADLTATEREHLLRALGKIHRTASDLLAGDGRTSRPSA